MIIEQRLMCVVFGTRHCRLTSSYLRWFSKKGFSKQVLRFLSRSHLVAELWILSNVLARTTHLVNAAYLDICQVILVSMVESFRSDLVPPLVLPYAYKAIHNS